jgi:hypothetical protein
MSAVDPVLGEQAAGWRIEPPPKGASLRWLIQPHDRNQDLLYLDLYPSGMKLPEPVPMVSSEIGIVLVLSGPHGPIMATEMYNLTDPLGERVVHDLSSAAAHGHLPLISRTNATDDGSWAADVWLKMIEHLINLRLTMPSA